MQLTKAEMARGRNPEAVQLARDIRASATTAVTEMVEIKKALS